MTVDSATDQGRRVFIEEAEELLAQLEESLMELEDAPDDQEIIGGIFRALHTIKGSGAMFGFEAISSFTHGVENVFDKVRAGEIPVSRDLIDTALKAKDLIKEMLDSDDGAGCDQAVMAGLKEKIDGFLQDGAAAPAAPPLAAPADTANGGQPLCSWRIRFRPPANIFATGMDPTMLLDDLKELGECDIVGMTEEIPRLSEIDPEALYIWWDILLTTDKGRNAIEDVFIFVADDADLNIELIQCHDDDADDGENGRDHVKKLGEILVERGDISADKLDEALSEQSKLGEILVNKGLISPHRLQSALKEQEHIKKVAQAVQQKAAAREKTASIRVASNKLDHLVNLVGELVTVQARLSQLAAGAGTDNQLIFLAEEVERLSAELRDNTMSIRMLPIGATFSKFRRLVRDLSDTLGKEIALSISGSETELDKTVIEKLKDPLVHLIRNSADHGIEPPEVRRQAGKPPEGSILLAAEHSGAHVLIRVSDDGAGLDPEKIKAKAVEKGLIDPEADLSDAEIYNLVFAPGFSTAKTVSNVSGRGVGMDVVKNNIDELRGEIEVESEPGRGTTVTLKIPLTLAIIEGLLARIGSERYVLPLSAVEECVELRAEDSSVSERRNLVNIRGELIPYVSLRERFGISGQAPAIEQIVVTNVLGTRIGFVVDEVIGQHQTVIKNLGRLYQNVREISGATILGDGSVALILDVAQMVHAAEESELASVR